MSEFRMPTGLFRAARNPRRVPLARIFIVGSGVVGTATGKGFIEAGHTVTFIDVALARLEQLRAEGLDARFTLDLPDEPSYVFMTLPTPNVGKSFDLSAFTSGTRSIADAIRRSPAMHTIVVRSTVPPGTTEGLVLTELEFGSGKRAGVGFGLASNPEFLRAATAEEDFRHPWMTVIASRNEATCLRLRELLAPFGGELKIFDDPAVAETIKCAHNLFNAAKISFWNEIWLVTEQLGIDHDAVSSTVAKSAEGSTNQFYGIRGGAPYGGVCLPKDTNGFLGFARELGVRMPVLEGVVAVNEQLASINSKELDALLDRRIELPDAVE
jgi:UDPglucose 6-dehydrogenase